MSDTSDPIAKPANKVSIKVRLNGPLVVSGPINVVDHDGNEVPCEGVNTAFCRCGLSLQKPFCDGSHRDGFDATPTNS